MKYFHLDSRVDKEMLNRFLEFANNNGEDDWTIAIWCLGGLQGMCSTILSIINSRKDRCTLICIDAYSGAFDIFYRSKCKKKLTPGCKGMIHQPSAEMRMDHDGTPTYYEDKAVVKNWKEEKFEYQFLLSKKEKKLYKKGEEVYLTFKRMKEIFPDAEII